MTTMEELYPLPFPVAEFRARCDAVRERMQAAGIDVLLLTSPENIYYLSGYHSLGYFTFQMMFLPVDRDPFILTRYLNTDTVRIMAWFDDVEGYQDTENVFDATWRCLEKYGLQNSRIGSQDDAWFFSVKQYRDLVARLGREPQDCSGIVEQVRMVKSENEIAYIRKAAECCAASMDAAMDAIRPGATDNDVSAAGHFGLHKAGSEYLGHSAQFVTGIAAGTAFECAKRRPILENDVFYIEAGGTYERYNAMLSRTAIIGKPDSRWVDMALASRDSLNAGIAAIKPGATSGEVDKAARDVIEKAGFAEGFRHRTGYAIGIGFPPDWGEGRIASLREGDPLVLEPNMVFHLIPDIKYPGEGGVVYSECVRVTETGCEVLNPYSQDLVYR